MAARSFQIVLGAGATRLSDVYLGLTAGGVSGPQTNIGGGVSTPDARSDVPYRQIILSASGAAAFIGGSDMAGTGTTPVSSATYGLRLDSTATFPATLLGAYETGPIKLSDLWASGSGATLHILATPF